MEDDEDISGNDALRDPIRGVPAAAKMCLPLAMS